MKDIKEHGCYEDVGKTYVSSGKLLNDLSLLVEDVDFNISNSLVSLYGLINSVNGIMSDLT